ncbi:hypothetical protein HALOI3_10096 [Halomonas sp. I3]|nr:hypothetical protein HALOI3_10096 [Halomonas sp. I3]
MGAVFMLIMRVAVALVVETLED